MNIDDLRAPPLPPWYKDVWYFYDWMAVLCSPPLLRGMRRAPIPEHLIRLLDAYLPFAKTSERWLHRPPDSTEMETRSIQSDEQTGAKRP